MLSADHRWTHMSVIWRRFCGLAERQASRLAGCGGCVASRRRQRRRRLSSYVGCFFFMTVVASVEIVCCLWLCGGGLGLILAKAIACLEPC